MSGQATGGQIEGRSSTGHETLPKVPGILSSARHPRERTNERGEATEKRKGQRETEQKTRGHPWQSSG